MRKIHSSCPPAQNSSARVIRFLLKKAEDLSGPLHCRTAAVDTSTEEAPSAARAKRAAGIHA